VAKTASVPGPLVAKIRGANLPHFGKQDKKQAYFPQEQKMGVLQGFPVLAGMLGMEKEPEMGLFYRMS